MTSAAQPLFTKPDAFTRKGLEAFSRAVDAVMPLSSAQRRELPYACRDLSAMLTTDRRQLELPYWSSPRLTSAYLRYFMPWNLVRLTALLPGLDLGKAPAEPLVLDMGTGPFTLPLALWLARPELRRLPVVVVGSDTAPHPMDLGRQIMAHMQAELDPASPWTTRSMRVSLQGAARQVRGRPWLVTMGNVLNELEDRDRRGGTLPERLAELVTDLAAVLAPGGHILAVEPGTRQGGRLITALRSAALHEPISMGRRDKDDWDHGDNDFPPMQDSARFDNSIDADTEADDDEYYGETSADAAPSFVPLAPCPHVNRCPMTQRGVSAWCHANAPARQRAQAKPMAQTPATAHLKANDPAAGAAPNGTPSKPISTGPVTLAANLLADAVPPSLRKLSQLAGMDKDSVSLSFLYLERANAEPKPAMPVAPGNLRARVISDPFVLPGYPGRARYACTANGLALIPDSAPLPPGCVCEVEPTPARDAKSRARIMTLAGRPPRREGAEPLHSSAERPARRPVTKGAPAPGRPDGKADPTPVPGNARKKPDSKAQDKPKGSKNSPNKPAGKKSKREPKRYFSD